MNIFNGFFAGLVILILSLYFMSSLQRFKNFLFGLVPASKRDKFSDIADQVGTSSVALHQQLFTEHSSDPEGSISLSLTYGF